MNILNDHGIQSRVIDGDDEHVMAEVIAWMPNGHVEHSWEIVACDIDSLRDWLGY